MLTAACGAASSTGPVASITTPADTVTTPAETVTTPADTVTTPAETVTAPADTVTTPVDPQTTPQGENQAGDTSTEPSVAECADLAGSGTYDDPYQLGLIDHTVVAEGCAPLTPGTGFNAAYFTFTLPETPGANAFAGAAFTLTEQAAGPVYPQIETAGGFILRDALTSGFWTGEDPDFTGRYQPIGNLAPGTYRMTAEKMDSPMHSMTTPYFTVVVDPDYLS